MDSFSDVDVDIEIAWPEEAKSCRDSVPAEEVTFTYTNAASIPGVAAYATEITEMLLALPTGVLIRESPTLRSFGSYTVTGLDGGGGGGGRAYVESFFDVFTELSLDGGQTWIPSAGAGLLLLVTPEPASLALLALGAAGLRRRRRPGNRRQNGVAN